MCLYKPGKFKVTKNYGYKWFACYNHGKLYSPINHHHSSGYRKYVWIRDLKANEEYYESWELGEENKKYLTGFHIYTNKKDASNSFLKTKYRELWKVEFKDYIVGYGDGSENEEARQIVARRMKIVERIK